MRNKYGIAEKIRTVEHLGVDAIAFNAHTPGNRPAWWRNRAREALARVKLFIDVALR